MAEVSGKRTRHQSPMSVDFAILCLRGVMLHSHIGKVGRSPEVGRKRSIKSVAGHHSVDDIG